MIKFSETAMERMASGGVLILRLALGGCIAAHGIQKLSFGVGGFAAGLESMGFPLPGVMAWISTLVELVGGVLVAVGFLTRPAAGLLAVNMLVAAIAAHGSAYFLPAGMEYALNLAISFAAIALMGPGRFSIDQCCCPCKRGAADVG